MAAIRTQREIRQRAPWYLFGLLVLNFALMSYDARDPNTKQRKVRSIAQTIMYPVQRGASGAFNWVGGLFGKVTGVPTGGSYDTQVDYKLVTLGSGQIAIQSKAAAKDQSNIDLAAQGVLTTEAQAVLGSVHPN